MHEAVEEELIQSMLGDSDGNLVCLRFSASVHSFFAQCVFADFFFQYKFNAGNLQWHGADQNWYKTVGSANAYGGFVVCEVYTHYLI